MNSLSKGTVSNGMEIETLESEAIRVKEVVVKIGGHPVELYEIARQKRVVNGKKVTGWSISPKLKKPVFIEDVEDEKAPPATLDDVA
jgi:hypothetical protein